MKRLVRAVVAAWLYYLAALAAIADDREAYDHFLELAGGERP